MSDRLARLEAELRFQRWISLALLLVLGLLWVGGQTPGLPAFLPRAEAGGVTVEGTKLYTTSSSGEQLFVWIRSKDGWAVTRVSAAGASGTGPEVQRWGPRGGDGH